MSGESAMINVAVMGASGRMGTEVCRAVLADPDLELAGAVDPAAREEDILPELTSAGITVHTGKDGLEIEAIDVIVDFTGADAAIENVLWALENGIHSVVGTTGIADPDMMRIKGLADSGKANVVVAANFALGAVLMMKFSETAARLFDQCEIIEMHHRGKLDSPSGTAMATAKRIGRVSKANQAPPADEREVKGSRGGRLGDVRIHSVRLDGLVAHQEVIFGSTGETLKIRHDTVDRSCFIPGVLIAVKAVGSTPGLTTGLEPLLDI
jgi:4-hydroxy-tetrahydrodipicolinate reductase